MSLLTDLATRVGALQGTAYTVLTWIVRSSLGAKLVKDSGVWQVGKVYVDEWVLDKMYPFEVASKKNSDGSDVFYSESDEQYTCEPWLNHHHHAESSPRVWSSTTSSGIEVMSSFKRNQENLVNPTNPIPMTSSLIGANSLTAANSLNHSSSGIHTNSTNSRTTLNRPKSSNHQHSNSPYKFEPRMANINSNSLGDSLKVQLTKSPIEETNMGTRRNLPCLPLDVTKMFGDESTSAEYYRPRAMSRKSVAVSLAGSDLIKGLNRVKIPENNLFAQKLGPPKAKTAKTPTTPKTPGLVTPKLYSSKKRADIKKKMEKYWDYFADSRKRFDIHDFQDSQALEVELLELTDSDNIFTDINTYFYVMDLIENKFKIQLYDSEVRSVIEHTDKEQNGMTNGSDASSVFQRQIQGRKGLLSLFKDITY